MNPNKILIIQTAFLGDVILSTPLIRALKKIFPDSLIDILTIPGTSIVFRDNPHVNSTLHFNKKKFINKIFSFIDLIFTIRKEQYDLALSIQSSFTSSLLMRLGNIPARVGFARQKLLTDPVSHKKGLHIRERYLKLMKPFTDKDFDKQTEIFWSINEGGKAKQIIKEINKDGKFIVGIAPGSVWKTKRWPKEYFVYLLKILKKEKVRVVLIGGPDDNLLCDDIIKKSESNTINLAGSLTILESAALIEKLDLVVSNDSAPLHIANAVKTDVIAFFGPTVRRFGCYPYRENDTMLEVDLPCRPCGKHGGNKCPEKHFKCMKDILPENVSAEIIKYLRRKKSE